MSVEVKGISKSYGAQFAVDDISFSILPGEVLGFLGPNGAGKSTTMKMITGYLVPNDGQIKICGIDILLDDIAAKKKIGYLPESNPLYKDMFVREYLYFMASIHKIENPEKRVNEVLAETGLLPESRKKISELSKGYKQRVGLAQAILHNPEVLILDEPTSGLDPNQLVEIRNLIKQLGKTKTVILSTHIMQEVQAMCSRVIIINNGKIIADDSVEKLSSIQDDISELIVEFDKEVSKDIFKSLSYIKRVNHLGGNRWEIQIEDALDRRKDLAEFAHSNNLVILEITKKQGTMESIFQKLTQKSNN